MTNLLYCLHNFLGAKYNSWIENANKKRLYQIYKHNITFLGIPQILHSNTVVFYVKVL